MLKNSIRLLRACGYKNINIDLMHGINGQTMESWEYSLDVARPAAAFPAGMSRTIP